MPVTTMRTIWCYGQESWALFWWCSCWPLNSLSWSQRLGFTGKFSSFDLYAILKMFKKHFYQVESSDDQESRAPRAQFWVSSRGEPSTGTSSTFISTSTIWCWGLSSALLHLDASLVSNILSLDSFVYYRYVGVSTLCSLITVYFPILVFQSASVHVSNWESPQRVSLSVQYSASAEDKTTT